MCLKTMQDLLRFLKKYPFQIKILLFILDFVFVIIAVKIYINYVWIETTIDDVHKQYDDQTQKVDFYRNFFLYYEQSEYSKYFLQHENNMLGNSEYVIKFENMPDKNAKIDENVDSLSNDSTILLTKPSEAWKRFFSEKLSWKQ